MLKNPEESYKANCKDSSDIYLIIRYGLTSAKVGEYDLNQLE